MRKLGSDAMERIVLALCERINTPRALSVWLCFKYNQAALLELPSADIANPSTEEFQLEYFITEYLQKYKGLRTKIDTASVALGKWKLSEQQCLETNKRFREIQQRPFSGRVDTALFRAQRKIVAVLGRLNLPVVLADCKWGPGATFDIPRMDATPDKKMTKPISVTASAQRYLVAVMNADPHWAACLTGVYPDGAYSLTKANFTIVRGSRFLTVPKSAKTDRCIAAEPTGNSFLQQAVSKYIRRRLYRFGIDLDKQSINQYLALEAYRYGFSTLDLSAASDTISKELIYHLLPLEWAHFLDDLRSHESCVNGDWIRTEKFASMGNAFCFELETLIFWALASSVTEVLGNEGWINVFGDDIIIPREAYDSVVEILTVCGFKVNPDKSFKDGYFFESCGKHFHRGREVTPAFQKETLLLPSEVIRAHNRLVRLETRLLVSDPHKIVGSALRSLCDMWKLRPFPSIPYGCEEDGGFLRPLKDFSLDPNHGFKCHVYDYVPRYTSAREDALYAYKLRRVERMNARNSGHADLPTKGRWRSKDRWVPLTATLGGPAPLDHKVLLGLS